MNIVVNVYQHMGVLTPLMVQSSCVVHLLTPKQKNLPLSLFQILWRIPSQYLHFPGGNAWQPAAKCWCLHAPVCLFFFLNVIGNMPRSLSLFL